MLFQLLALWHLQVNNTNYVDWAYYIQDPTLWLGNNLIQTYHKLPLQPLTVETLPFSYKFSNHFQRQPNCRNTRLNTERLTNNGQFVHYNHLFHLQAELQSAVACMAVSQNSSWHKNKRLYEFYEAKRRQNRKSKNKKRRLKTPLDCFVYIITII